MADDDVPLAALAKKPSVSKVTDDTPLSSLAASAAPKNTPQKRASSKSLPKPAGSPKPGTPAAAGRAAAKGRPKAAAGAKRRASSSSSSSSYSYSSSSDSEDNKALKRGGSGKVAKKRALALKKRRSADEGLGEVAETGGAVKKKERNQKEDLVAQLLCRWWFADDYMKQDWPPQEESFYEAKLAQLKLRKVTVHEWEWLPETDENGLKKVYELSQFRGVFRNSAGELVDLRPQETCPCFNNFMKKEVGELCTMLVSAYENQLKELRNCRYIKEAERAASEIKVALTHVRNTQVQARAMAGR